MTEDDIISGIIAREGSSFTNRADDLGHETKFGITLATLRAVRGPSTTAADVEALTEGEAREIYRKVFIEGPNFSGIRDDKLRVAAIDWGVNSGEEPAIHALQNLVGVVADGKLGPITLAKINAAADPRHLMILLCRLRALFDAHLCQRDPSQLANLAGWTDRIWSFIS